jgi:hypothetical protein
MLKRRPLTEAEKLLRARDEGQVEDCMATIDKFNKLLGKRKGVAATPRIFIEEVKRNYT